MLLFRGPYRDNALLIFCARFRDREPHELRSLWQLDPATFDRESLNRSEATRDLSEIDREGFPVAVVPARGWPSTEKRADRLQPCVAIEPIIGRADQEALELRLDGHRHQLLGSSREFLSSGI